MTMLGRTIDFNEDGFATIGQYPDLIADLQADGLSQEDLEPLFHSAEAYVRSWGKAQAAALNMPGRMTIKSSLATPPSDVPVKITISASDVYFDRPLTTGKVFVNGIEKGVLGVPFTLVVPSRTVPCVCHTERYPHPHKVCEGGTASPGLANFTVRGVPRVHEFDAAGGAIRGAVKPWELRPCARYQLSKVP